MLSVRCRIWHGVRQVSAEVVSGSVEILNSAPGLMAAKPGFLPSAPAKLAAGIHDNPGVPFGFEPFSIKGRLGSPAWHGFVPRGTFERVGLSNSGDYRKVGRVHPAALFHVEHYWDDHRPVSLKLPTAPTRWYSLPNQPLPVPLPRIAQVFLGKLSRSATPSLPARPQEV